MFCYCLACQRGSRIPKKTCDFFYVGHKLLGTLFAWWVGVLKHFPSNRVVCNKTTCVEETCMKILEEFGFPYFQEKKPFSGYAALALLLGL